jgi:hypothetical protein
MNERQETTQADGCAMGNLIWMFEIMLSFTRSSCLAVYTERGLPESRITGASEGVPRKLEVAQSTRKAKVVPLVLRITQKPKKKKTKKSLHLRNFILMDNL